MGIPGLKRILPATAKEKAAFGSLWVLDIYGGGAQNRTGDTRIFSQHARASQPFQFIASRTHPPTPWRKALLDTFLLDLVPKKGDLFGGGKPVSLVIGLVFGGSFCLSYQVAVIQVI